MITAAVKGPTGKSVFIEAEKVIFLDVSMVKIINTAHSHPVAFRLSSWNDPWGKASEIVITSLILLDHTFCTRDWLVPSLGH
jgi:hypothetical protein